MSIETLVPKEFSVPERLETPKFLIRMLKKSDVDLDYKAVMSSIDEIVKTRGGTWPTNELTQEEDLKDLFWHENEFKNKTSFAYTVMNPDQTECLGCFYFYKPNTRKPAPNDSDVDVSFWVTQKAYDKGLYIELYQTIKDWMEKEWPFKNPFWTNLEIPQV